MTPIDVGLSFASSSAADSGKTGDFNVSGGASKQTSMFLIVGGVVAFLGFIAWLKLR